MHTTTEDTQNPKSTSRLRRRCRLPLVATTAVACAAAALTACGSKTDANEKNFSAALNQYFDKKGDLCLDTWNIKRWPIDVGPEDLGRDAPAHGKANRMAVLEAIGLVKSEEAEVDDPFSFHPEKYKVKRYTLTDAAKPFLRGEEEVISSSGEKGKVAFICWGKKALDKIVKWEGPVDLAAYQGAYIVTYTYQVNNVADWAKRPDVQAAFPIKYVLDGVGSKEGEHAVTLTSEGWEGKGDR